MAKKSQKKQTSGTSENFFKNPVFYFSIFAIISIAALVGFAFNLSNKSMPASVSSEVIVDGDKQSVAIMAKNGFNPGKVTLKSDKTTTIKVKTENTFDCANTILFPSLGITKELPTTGVTDVTIPPQKAGTKITAVCGAGHYNLELDFM